jgi:hypothetical protein
MYQVIRPAYRARFGEEPFRKGESIFDQEEYEFGCFELFVDAWLFVKLNLTIFVKIRGPEGEWRMEPTQVN